jgi:membrane protein implicated in regulation of membrane protease activity
MVTPRLIYAIISILVEEAAIVVIALVGLPQLGIKIPLGVLIAVMVVFAIFSVFLYQAGSRALRRKPIALSAMIGTKGKAVNPLTPAGLIKIKDELWEAESIDGKIGIGEEVLVIGQDGLKLMVRKANMDG